MTEAVSLVPLNNPDFMDINSLITLMLIIFQVVFIAYFLGHIANFFPKLFASVTRKYKNKQNMNIDYNREFFSPQKYMMPVKKEVKKNHGKRIPFFNKR